MTPRIKNAILIAAFALLAVLAVAGWTRNPNAVGATNFASPSGVYTASSPTPAQSVAYAPAEGNCVERSGQYTNTAYAPSADAYSYAAPRYRTYNRPRVVRTRYATEREPVREVVVRDRRGRSTGKSVAIVAGSAGTGAAIGAIAGGGKGAALGALSGGAAGFVYDRLTHNR